MDTDVARALPLTPMQQGMLYHALAAPDSGVDIEQIVIRMDEPLDTDAFESAWREVIARHDILRTRFAWQGRDEPVQIVASVADLPVERHDWRDRDDADLDRVLDDDRGRPFDLARAPAMRLCLIRTGAESWRVVWTFHHILLDGRSFPLVLGEVMQVYDALRAGSPPPALQPPRSFAQFVAWQQTQDVAAGKRFWARQLHGFTAPTPLPWAPPVRDTHDDRHGVAHGQRRLSAETTARLSEQVAAAEGGWSALIETVWAVLLWRHTRATDIVMGTTRAGRRDTIDGAQDMIGLFINTVPARLRIDPDASLAAHMATAYAHQQAMRPHQHLGLAQIQRQSQIQPGSGGLFETLVLYDHRVLDDAMTGRSNQSKRHFSYRGRTGYPLTLFAYGGTELLLELEFDRARIDTATANDVLDRLVVLLGGLAEAGPSIALRELPWLTAADVHDCMTRWNDTAHAAPAYACIHDALAAQAAVQPDAVALQIGPRSVSYAGLLVDIDALAARLQQAGVRIGDRVLLATGRSEHMIIAMLAVQKAGAAYVPCDPRYPAERIALMVADAGAKIVLTEQAVADNLPDDGLTKWVMDTPDAAAPGAARAVPITPDLPAYVIFTSGSTGRPKGVVVTHGNVMNFLMSMAGTPGLSAGQRMLAVTTLSFDIAVLELFLPLTVGATVVVAMEDDVLDGARLAAIMQDQRVDTMQATPTTYRLLLAAGWTPPANFTALVGGEALDPALAENLGARAASGFSLWNMYGPTETTVWSTCEAIGVDGVGIGAPIANTRCYVVDENDEPVAPGVIGELLIAGDGVTAGYLDRPGLTAERYVDLGLLPDMPVQRMYRTGDHVRWQRQADGSGRLIYVERIDAQVKLRGYRIEPGEIEALLTRQPSIDQAVVMLRHEGGDRLVAYLSASDTVDTAALRSDVAGRLPAHMVPAVFMVLDAFPLTANAKIDRKALPVPEGRVETGNRYVAPRTPGERAIADIWRDVLDVHRPGIDDNFFDLGGDSLRLVSVLGRMQHICEALTIADLFRYATIRQLADYVDADRSAYAPDTSALDERARKRRAALARRRQARA